MRVAGGVGDGHVVDVHVADAGGRARSPRRAAGRPVKFETSISAESRRRSSLPPASMIAAGARRVLDERIGAGEGAGERLGNVDRAEFGWSSTVVLDVVAFAQEPLRVLHDRGLTGERAVGVDQDDVADLRVALDVGQAVERRSRTCRRRRRRRVAVDVDDANVLPVGVGQVDGAGVCVCVGRDVRVAVDLLAHPVVERVRPRRRPGAVRPGVQMT